MSTADRFMKFNVKKLTETATLPTQGTVDSAGWDLYANIQEPLLVPCGQSVMVGTGVAMEIPKGFFGGIYARSGLACKRGLRPANCVGVIDADYRGEVKVKIHNDSLSPQFIEPQERIAQLIIQPYLQISLTEVDELDDTERGEGGFGSTGTH